MALPLCLALLGKEHYPSRARLTTSGWHDPAVPCMGVGSYLNPVRRGAAFAPRLPPHGCAAEAGLRGATHAWHTGGPGAGQLARELACTLPQALPGVWAVRRYPVRAYDHGHANARCATCTPAHPLPRQRGELLRESLPGHPRRRR